MEPTDAKTELEKFASPVSITPLASGTSIDFHLFDLYREGVTDNFVFRGTRFVGGVIRLPRIHKDNITNSTLKNEIWNILPFEQGISVRLEPELEQLAENQDSYWYSHIEFDKSFSLEEAVIVARTVSNNWDSSKYNSNTIP